MTKLLIVPNVLRDTIHDRITEQMPDIDAEQRDILYHEMLAIFDQYGYLPDFRIERKASPDEPNIVDKEGNEVRLEADDGNP